MIMMDYRLVLKEEEYSLLLQGNMNSLFSDSDDSDWIKKLEFSLMLVTSIDSCIEFFVDFQNEKKLLKSDKQNSCYRSLKLVLYSSSGEYMSTFCS